MKNQTFFTIKTFPEKQTAKTQKQTRNKTKPRSCSYIDEARIKVDQCLIVQDIHNSLMYPRKPLDSFLNRSSTCRACHSKNRESHSLCLLRRTRTRTQFHAVIFGRHPLGVLGHGGIVWPRRKVAMNFTAQAS